jgi:hypothetical protein
MPRRLRKGKEILNLTNAKYEEQMTRLHIPEEKTSSRKPNQKPAKRKSKRS